VQEIEAAILKLSREDLDRLREWLIELDAAKWDEEFEEDAATGKLDPIAEEAIAEFRSGIGATPSDLPVHLFTAVYLIARYGNLHWRRFIASALNSSTVLPGQRSRCHFV